MKLLVTGASGYLGGRLCWALLREGHEVRAFVRRTSDVSHLPSPAAPGGGAEGGGGRLELAYGDVTDLSSLLSACAGCEVLFHAAALVEPWMPDPSLFFSVNVGGLENVLEAYRETHTIRKIIYTSSIFALVHHEKFFCSEYEKSKAMADKVARQAASEGIPIVLLYPGFIYGSGKLTTGNIIARLMIERFNGRLPCYVGHGRLGHLAAMNRGQVGERYLLTGENASLEQIFDLAAAITRTRRPWFHIPLWLLNVYGWISVFFSHITGKLPLISYPTVTIMRHQWEYSCEKAKDDLGYAPRSLDQGLGEMLPWLKSLG
ncbi:unnamed protein product [Spirodela intermedia]|uniref:NAD-dependent epimerase/dehydratase domain-containing protein n=1 Tax=Spirodela intermedia TaxID=51605 RepID=A0A7I8IPF1_SPIIN|nr:unnamed protein product [Spirodela intermedia]CAA6659444.1 unnamed protein product [Spirodela intermedia]